MANTSPPPVPPLDLAEAFRISSGGTASSHQVDLKLTPLNLLHWNTSKKYSFTIRPYSAGQKYYAISYTWPNPSWERWGGSDRRTETVEITHDKTLTGLTERAETYTTEHFSRFAVEAYATLDASVPVWIDHECTHQEVPAEQYAQVAVMDSIYSAAVATVVLLEDIALSSEERGFLERKTPRKRGSDLERHSQLVRKIVKARWFTRAWCTQEMLLSSRTMVFVHNSDSGEAVKPHMFTMEVLRAWMTYDTTIPPLSTPRGMNQFRKDDPDAIGMNTVAWAFGVVHNMGCYDPFDKVHLVLNLVRTPVSQRLVDIPKAPASEDPNAQRNVCKIVNTYAAMRGDFSLWLTAHAVPRESLEEGFGWAGVPVKGDPVSEGWVRKDYCLGRDASPWVDATGILLRGFAGKVRTQKRWRIWRDEGKKLHASVDGVEKTLDAADWLETPALQTERHLRPLIDLCYAIEAFEARDIYPYFVPPPQDENWTEHPGFVGNLKEDMLLHFLQLGPRCSDLMQTLRFMQADDGVMRFEVVRLEDDETPLVVKGNIEELVGKIVFQPHVIRPKVFAMNILTVNSMVLGEEGKGRRRCVGGLRGFGLIPETLGEVQVKVC